MKKRYALLPLALVLSACANPANEIPTPSAESTIDEQVDSQAQRAEQVFASLNETVGQITDSETLTNAENRLAGPALQILRAQVDQSQRYSRPELLDKVYFTNPQSSWGVTTEYPRIAMAFTEEPEDGNVRQLVTLTQENGQSNYKLWGFVTLFPGEGQITLASDTTGLTSDYSEGLVASPDAVLEDYIKVLNGTEATLPFEASPLLTSMTDQREAVKESVGEVGESSLTAAARDDYPVMVLQTEDGGVVSMAAIRYNTVIKRTVEGSTISVGTTLASFLGDDDTYDIKGTLTARYELMIAFYIPPEGDQKITVLGASDPTLFTVADDETTNPDN